MKKLVRSSKNRHRNNTGIKPNPNTTLRTKLIVHKLRLTRYNIAGDVLRATKLDTGLKNSTKPQMMLKNKGVGLPLFSRVIQPPNIPCSKDHEEGGVGDDALAILALRGL